MNLILLLFCDFYFPANRGKCCVFFVHRPLFLVVAPNLSEGFVFSPSCYVVLRVLYFCKLAEEQRTCLFL